jgi:hypothetical protein
MLFPETIDDYVPKNHLSKMISKIKMWQRTVVNAQ